MHRFRITIEPVSKERSSQESLHFEVTNHDDILDIVSRRPTRPCRRRNKGHDGRPKTAE